MKDLREEIGLDEISKRKQDHYVIMTIIYDELMFLYLVSMLVHLGMTVLHGLIVGFTD